MNRWTCSPSLLRFPASLFQLMAPALRFVCALVVVTGVATATWASDKAAAHVVASATCTVTEPAGDDSTDIRALDQYKAFMQRLLVQEKFGDLDCLADSARSGKTKFQGGMWKLHALYGGLDAPRGHATEEDWNAHLARLNR